jgi:predicted N-acyltransferase
MPDASPEYTLSLHPRIAEIDPADWDACAGGNPFVSHAFLSALEDSGSTGERTGWFPQHAALRDAAGLLVGCAPCYAKANSYGEYVFDHGWANAYERAGGSYYPKLQVAAPFSPVPGPRLLTRPDHPHALGALAAGLRQAMAAQTCSSIHITFCTRPEWDALGEAGWLQRIGTQFHWTNEGFASFDDFLGLLSSRKRKDLRKERSSAVEGLTIRHFTNGAWEQLVGKVDTEKHTITVTTESLSPFALAIPTEHAIPTMNVTVPAPGQQQFQWVSDTPGWVLEESADLINWVPSSRVVSTVGNTSTVTVAAGGVSCFLRLAHP